MITSTITAMNLFSSQRYSFPPINLLQAIAFPHIRFSFRYLLTASAQDMLLATWVSCSSLACSPQYSLHILSCVFLHSCNIFVLSLPHSHPVNGHLHTYCTLFSHWNYLQHDQISGRCSISQKEDYRTLIP